MKAGEHYAAAIVQAINSCRVLVLALSRNSIDSSHVLREVERASSKSRPVLVVRLDSAELPPELEYFLSATQWLDASHGSIERIVPALIESIRGRASTPAARVAAAPASSTASTPSARSQSGRRWAMLLAGPAAVIIGVAYLVSERISASKQAPSDASEKSIAVLPFADMSEKKDQEYFSDGLSEELIDLLTKIPELRVPARTSSFYFKGKSEDIQTIARKLLVAHVLEGSVRRSGNHLRVTAQLVRADNGYHLWSETYDRNVDDIFKVQDDIAGAVVKALRVSLLQTEAPRAAPTTSSEAYTLYLRAQALAKRESTSDTVQAHHYLQQALKLDPQFALAWAALAEDFTDDTVDWDTVFLPNDTDGAAADAIGQNALAVNASARSDKSNFDWASVAKIVVPGSHDAADQALKFGPNLPESHLAMARVRLYVDWDWAAAESEINKARELDPRNARATQLAATWAITVGRLREAIDFARLAVVEDPLGTANFELGKASHRLGDLAEAEKAYQQLLVLYPNSTGFHYRFALVLLALGRAQEALEEFNRDIPPYRQAGVPLALDALGRRAEADHEIAILEQRWGGGMAYQISYVYASRNDAERAMHWLERAYDQHDDGLLSMLHDPQFRNIEREPRFKALLHKMKLAE